MEYDCADFALQTLIDYSELNNLPLQIKTSSGILDAQSDEYSTAEQFGKIARAKFGTGDIMSNTVKIPASERQKGDMRLLKLTFSNNHIYTHTIVYGNIEEDFVMWGNHTATRATQVFGRKKQKWILDGKDYKGGDGRFNTFNLQGNDNVLRWDFEKFNGGL